MQIAMTADTIGKKHGWKRAFRASCQRHEQILLVGSQGLSYPNVVARKCCLVLAIVELLVSLKYQPANLLSHT